MCSPPEEDVEEDDPRWDLIRQLVEYKKFKEAAARLGEREALQNNLFARPATASRRRSVPLGEVSVFDLINAFNKVLKRLNQQEDLRENLRGELHGLGQDRPES